MGWLPGVDAVYGISHVLASKHQDAKGEEQHHSGWAVEVEHRSVDLESSHLQQKARTIG
jgi:hypothetical protein